MLKRIMLFTILMIATLLVVNQVVIPHARRSRGNEELRVLSLQKGQEVILRAIAANGGLATWLSKVDVSFRLIDKWHSPVGAVFADWLDMWPQRKIETVQHYLLRRKAGRIEMTTARGHHVWGYSNFRPWALVNGRIDAENVARANFTIPAIDYLMELPYKFLDNGAFPEFVNEMKQGGRIYDRVRITFGLNAGNYPPDEYLADFDQDTGRLAHLEYTIRTKMPGYVKFSADFNNYQQTSGLWIPTQIDFKLNTPLVDFSLHNWKISEVQFNTGIDENFFTPAAFALADTGWH
ncbi:MAG: hypothetical protein ONB44_12095 [candidate division KSB1 bacterium]|nr:hypothetical protein [candidate division KSB1 bacterium]MDZ7302861.1 hypothetical protein [candidate division KSB1 bacterium]MDZ7311878.1 hypothetical protein [candidate division KSB1 bacterium]